jgi:RNA polymerase sigma-70 factor (ECF subfamily)
VVVADMVTSQGYLGVRPYLFSVAYRMTGSASDAEDLVQDAWIRYLSAGSPPVDSLRAYLTTIVSRLALDHLKSARVQRESYIGPWQPEPVLTEQVLPGPDATVEQREEISLALLTLLEELTPEQRVVYVLREAFELGHDEIAAHIGKSSAACRQIYSRARRQIDRLRQPAIAPLPEHQQIVDGFVSALETGDASAMARLLAEDVTWIGDGGGKRLATQRPVYGRDRVTRGLVGLRMKMPAAIPVSRRLVELNGAPGLLVCIAGMIEQAMVFDVDQGQITAIRTIRNPDKLQRLAHILGTEVTPDLPGFPTRAARPSESR